MKWSSTPFWYAHASSPRLVKFGSVVEDDLLRERPRRSDPIEDPGNALA
jgi:hypothetical protein